jgi:hypothetical protein
MKPPCAATRRALLALALLAALAPGASRACGACDEDKVAAAYDHAVVQGAAARGDVVVFCAVQGSGDVQRLKRSTQRLRGVRPDSVRASAEPPSLSFVVDPKLRSPQAAVAAAERAAPGGTRLTIIRLLDAPATTQRRDNPG